MLELGRRPLDGVAQPLPVARHGDQHAEDEASAQHDLLDVDHLDPRWARVAKIDDVTPGRSLPVSVISRVSGWLIGSEARASLSAAPRSRRGAGRDALVPRLGGPRCRCRVPGLGS